MKVLFLTSTANFSIKLELLGMMYISAVLKQHGHECVNLELESAQAEGLLEVVRRENPAVVAFSATTGVHTLYFEPIRQIKQACPEIITIMGGPHPTFIPEVIAQPGLDAVCRGEGEYAMLDLLEALQSGQDWHHIPNLWTKQSDGTIVENPLRPFLTESELDQLPFPDRELMAIHPEVYQDGVMSVMTGRGCPNRCSYCFNRKARELAEGRYVRRHSVERVMAEIHDALPRTKAEFISFQDDIFILHRDWLREFSPRYRQEVNLPYICHVSVDLVDEEIAQLLADSNCRMVAAGLENGNEEFRRRMLHKKTSNEQVVRAAQILKSAGIQFFTQNMIGFPEETPADAIATAELNAKAGTDVMNIYYYQPYPGTWAGDYARKHGLCSDSYEEIPSTFYEPPKLESPWREDFEELWQLNYLGKDFPIFLPLLKLAYLHMKRGSIWRRGLVRGLFFLHRRIRRWPILRRRATCIPGGIENLR